MAAAEIIRKTELTITDKDELEKRIRKIWNYCKFEHRSRLSEKEIEEALEGHLRIGFAAILDDTLIFESSVDGYNAGYQKEAYDILKGCVNGYIEWYGNEEEPLWRDIFTDTERYHVCPELTKW